MSVKDRQIANKYPGYPMLGISLSFISVKVEIGRCATGGIVVSKTGQINVGGRLVWDLHPLPDHAQDDADRHHACDTAQSCVHAHTQRRTRYKGQRSVAGKLNGRQPQANGTDTYGANGGEKGKREVKSEGTERSAPNTGRFNFGSLACSA